MKTKEIIERTGLDRETLRFYESKGLLPIAKRTESGYRIYPESVLGRIDFIIKAKKAGFTLIEIKGLIDIQHKRGPCRVARDTVKNKKEEIKERILALKDMDAILQKFINECEKNGEASLNKPCHFLFDECC